MTHNNFRLRNDIIHPIGEFLNLTDETRPYEPVIKEIDKNVIRGLENYRMKP